MKKRMMVRTIGTASGANPEYTGILATDDQGESVELVLRTRQIPALAAGLVLASQWCAERIAPEKLAEDSDLHVTASMETRPKAIDLALSPDGDILAVNVISGVLFFELTDALQQKLQEGGGIPVIDPSGL